MRQARKRRGRRDEVGREGEDEEGAGAAGLGERAVAGEGKLLRHPAPEITFKAP